MSSSHINEKIDAVFAPRSTDYKNAKLFINRSDYSSKLVANIKSSFHGLVIGENGIGKTWLVGKVILNERYKKIYVNCANIKNSDSIEAAVCESLQDGKMHLEKETTTKVAGINAGGKAELSTAKEYSQSSQGHHLDELRKFMSKSPKVPHVLVLDNAEFLVGDADWRGSLQRFMVSSETIKNERSALKIITIVASRNIEENVTEFLGDQAINTRIEELDPVRGFNEQEVYDFVSRGFNELLHANLGHERMVKWVEHIHHVTFGIPLYLHEYCNKLAKLLLENNWTPGVGILSSADAGYCGMNTVTTSHRLSRLHLVDGKSMAARVMFIVCNIKRTSFSCSELMFEYNVFYNKKTQL